VAGVGDVHGSCALARLATYPEAASLASVAAARFEAQIAQAIPADDASLRAAIISAITLGVMVSRHLIKSDELATADPAHVINLLRPCLIALTAEPPSPAPLAISQLRARAGPGTRTTRSLVAALAPGADSPAFGSHRGGWGETRSRSEGRF
jgi:hypothetical protein